MPRSPLNFIIEKDLNTHWSVVQDAIKHSTNQQAYQFDKGCQVPNLKVGDEVLINLHSLKLINKKGLSRKLKQRKTGPFEVIKFIGPTAYKLRLPDAYKGHNMFNLQHLSKYYQSNDTEHPKIADLQDALASSKEYEVKKIVGEQKQKGSYTIEYDGKCNR